MVIPDRQTSTRDNRGKTGAGNGHLAPNIFPLDFPRISAPRTFAPSLLPGHLPQETSQGLYYLIDTPVSETSEERLEQEPRPRIVIRNQLTNTRDIRGKTGAGDRAKDCNTWSAHQYQRQPREDWSRSPGQGLSAVVASRRMLNASDRGKPQVDESLDDVFCRRTLLGTDLMYWYLKFS